VTVAALLSDVSIAVKIKKYFLTADFLLPLKAFRSLNLQLLLSGNIPKLRLE